MSGYKFVNRTYPTIFLLTQDCPMRSDIKPWPLDSIFLRLPWGKQRVLPSSQLFTHFYLQPHGWSGVISTSIFQPAGAVVLMTPSMSLPYSCCSRSCCHPSAELCLTGQDQGKNQIPLLRPTQSLNPKNLWSAKPEAFLKTSQKQWWSLFQPHIFHRGVSVNHIPASPEISCPYGSCTSTLMLVPHQYCKSPQESLHNIWNCACKAQPPLYKLGWLRFFRSLEKCSLSCTSPLYCSTGHTKPLLGWSCKSACDSYLRKYGQRTKTCT